METMATTTAPRLNLLLSYGGWREESWVDHLPRLLTPMGIHSIKVETGREAETVIRAIRIHIAVIDLAIPLVKGPPSHPHGAEPGGARILQLLRRVEPTPPTIVVRDSQRSESDRSRGLSSALREGAFAVIDRPVQVETMLEMLRRITRRYYADRWPTN